ncbi:MAG: hypothetical protein M3539_17900, partial [Acidobacteriota bacterium]|nr:hypothetical protein [Acidobacteriota bacterium]
MAQRRPTISKPFTANNRGFVLNVLVAAICVVFIAMAVVPTLVPAQRRNTRRQTRPTTQRIVIDYSKFSHATSKHQQACNTCHRMPTRNWQKARGYPDVADYPDHDACVGCHRAQFFRGPRPAICAGCHSKVSPRDDARFEFRNPTRQQQFAIEFPHDKHQDVIARLQPFAKPVSGQPFRFVQASFKASPWASADEKTYNNCAICHLPRSGLPLAPASGWTDGFIPDSLTFKSVPTDHGACFNCHWKAEQPISENCAGCHKPATPPLADMVVKRISMKFRHEGGGERKTHVAECTTCHINITRAATLRGLKPDVPIT